MGQAALQLGPELGEGCTAVPQVWLFRGDYSFLPRFSAHEPFTAAQPTQHAYFTK